MDNIAEKARISRVDPEGRGVYGIAHADMSTGTLCEAPAGKDPERTGHVLQLPLTLPVRVVNLGNAGELVSTGCECSVSPCSLLGELSHGRDGVTRLLPNRLDSGGGSHDFFVSDLWSLTTGFAGEKQI